MAHQLDSAPPVLSDFGINELGPVRLERGQSARLVEPQEAAVADHVAHRMAASLRSMSSPATEAPPNPNELLMAV